jgi:hypothetical protein
MKTFRENYEPIEMTIANVNGEEFTIKSQFLDSGKFAELEKLLKDKERSAGERGIETMVFLCGEKKKFWEQFSPMLLTEVTNYIYEEIGKKKRRKENG